MIDEVYDRMYEVEDRHWWFAGKRAIINDLLERFLLRRTSRRPLKLADLGCGCGRALVEFAPEFETCGIDSSEKAIEYCRARGVQALRGSLPDDLPFERGSFDAVVLADVLEHIERDADAAREAGKLLAPGGIMVVTVPALPALWSRWDEIHGHLRRYTRRALGDVVGASGLEVELLSYCNTLLFPAAAAARLAGRASRRVASAQLETPPEPVNTLLRRVFSAERRLLGRVTLPVGLSLAAVARRKA